ncbi:hypothetical protein G3N18_01885 [Microbacterium sp. 2C]|uniref:hypothetical protein n=1 Tax=Microbacterium paulum TaxID=2707006 RepID=UPI0018C2F2CE|nr:hypothetical protein [Microbacterium paulum]MBG0716837.1 hypothetical protein [Microbacterium paulum]
MNTTQTAPAPDAEESASVTVTGTVRSPLTLTRRISDRTARVSFRIDGPDGAYNVHASGSQAELIRVAVRKGDTVTVTAVRATRCHPAQTIPDLEVRLIDLDLEVV